MNPPPSPVSRPSAAPCGTRTPCLIGILNEGDAPTEQLLAGPGQERVATLLPGGAQLSAIRRLIAERRACRGSRARGP